MEESKVADPLFHKGYFMILSTPTPSPPVSGLSSLPVTQKLETVLLAMLVQPPPLDVLLMLEPTLL